MICGGYASDGCKNNATIGPSFTCNELHRVHPPRSWCAYQRPTPGRQDRICVLHPSAPCISDASFECCFPRVRVGGWCVVVIPRPKRVLSPVRRAASYSCQCRPGGRSTSSCRPTPAPDSRGSASKQASKQAGHEASVPSPSTRAKRALHGRLWSNVQLLHLHKLIHSISLKPSSTTVPSLSASTERTHRHASGQSPLLVG